MTTLGRSMSLQVNTGASSTPGSAAAQPQSQAGSLFSSTPSQPGGLFGGASSAGTAQTGGGGLFGAAKPKPALSIGVGGSTLQPSAGGLFGGTTASQAQPAGFAPAASASASLFPSLGSLGTQPQPAAGTSLFGGAAKPTVPAQTSLFGGAAATQQPAASLFGSTLAQPQAQQLSRPSLFSLSGSQQAGTASMQQQPQQVFPGVKIDWSNIKPTTRFEDLHPDIQKQLCAIDDFIQGQIQMGTQIGAALNAQGQLVESLSTDVKYLEGREEVVELAVESDAREVKSAKDYVTRDAEDAKVSFAAIENLKLPLQFQYQPGGSAPSGLKALDDTDHGVTSGDLISYFQTKSGDVEARVASYTKQLRELEEHMSTVEYSTVENIQRLARAMSRPDAGADTARREQMAELVATLRGVEDAIFRAAGRVGETREDVVALQFPHGTQF